MLFAYPADGLAGRFLYCENEGMESCWALDGVRALVLVYQFLCRGVLQRVEY